MQETLTFTNAHDVKLVPQSPQDDFIYCGKELELFRHAQTWKNYYASKIMPYIRGDVLEVGAGIGETSKVLCRQQHPKWVLLEPDIRQIGIINRRINEGALPACCETFAGLLSAYPDSQKFDTILYIDVIEHIEHDRQEVHLAANYLKPGGHLIILCPANMFLYSPFDQEIGHYRRYNKSMYQQLNPPGLKVKKIFYLDSVGMCASLVNKLILRQQMPTLSQIKFWDNLLVPMSKLMDFLTGYQLGKSIVGVWENVKSISTYRQ